MSGRATLATLAPPRRRWVRDLSRWATTGDLPADVLTCLAGDELRALLGTGRHVSLVVVDAGSSALDRDLVALAGSVGSRVVVVDDGRHQRDWESVGCAELVPEPSGPSDVVELVERHGQLEPPARRQGTRVLGLGRAVGDACRVVAVTGAGDASTIAAAAAQHFGAAPRGRSQVALVDGTRRSTQTVLHAPTDVVPGIAELVDAHRNDAPDPEVVRTFLHPVADRGYDLLLGLARTRDWAGLRPLALAAALDTLTRTYSTLVVHHDPDVDGMASTGSVEVEERHTLSRWAVDHADLVVVVAQPDLSALHGLAAVRADLLDHGVSPDRLLVVVHPLGGGRARQVADVELRRAVGGPFAALGRCRGVEQAHRAAGPLPRRLVAPLGRALDQALHRAGARSAPGPGTTVVPGELGTRLDRFAPHGGEAA